MGCRVEVFSRNCLLGGHGKARCAVKSLLSDESKSSTFIILVFSDVT